MFNSLPFNIHPDIKSGIGNATNKLRAMYNSVLNVVIVQASDELQTRTRHLKDNVFYLYFKFLVQSSSKKRKKIKVPKNSNFPLKKRTQLAFQQVAGHTIEFQF